MEHQQKKRRSLSRSPSLSRRSSLRGGGGGSGSEKSSLPSTSSSGIKKSKSKRNLSILSSGPGTTGVGGGSGSKKERWLLTRKTWRYMTDAVGNLLPEYYAASAAVSVGSGKSGGTGLRRGSSSASSSGGGGGGYGYVSGSGGVPTATPTPLPSSSASSYYSCYPGTSVAAPPSSSGYTSYSLSSPPFRQSVPRSSICSSSGTVPLVEEEESVSIPQAAEPGKIDIPALEKHFEQACSKENKFLLWTRNKAKGLSGPALREAKLKEKEKQQQQQQQQGKSGKGGTGSGSGGGGIFSRRRRDGGGGEFEETGSSGGPMHLTRSQSSSSSLMTMGGSSSVGGMRTGRRATQDLLDYFSPGEEEGGLGVDEDDLLMMDDADDYDEYDDEHDDQPALRRKSSTTSSIVSMVSGGLSFFRSHHPQGGKGKSGQGQAGLQSQHQQHPPQYSTSLGTIFIRTIPSTGVQKYYRNSAVQTEPFPEEILVRLRLQFIHEENQLSRALFMQAPYVAPQQPGGGLTQHQQQLRHVMTLPIDKSASSPAFPHLQQGTRVGSSQITTSATAVMTTGSLSATASPVGTPTTAMTESAGVPSQIPAPPPPPPPPPEQIDKKSEESGYSSASISDTVMRYLRMARKSSKADNKEIIDKFKTVNYDRSLRYIKSKNVTVEEALEHEKNKALQAAQQKLGIVPDKPAAPEATASATAASAAARVTETGAGAAKGTAATGTQKSTEIKAKSKSGTKTKKTKSGVKKGAEKKEESKEAGAAAATTAPAVGDGSAGVVEATGSAEPAASAAAALTHEDVEMTTGAGGTGGGDGSDSNAASTPQTPLSPTSTSAPSSSIYSSSRSGSGSSSVPPLSPPPLLLSSTGAMMIQGSMIISGSGTPVLQSSITSHYPGVGAVVAGGGGPHASSPPYQQQPTVAFPPPPLTVGIGIQAGEALVHLLKNYNPARKFSDFSIAGSEYYSSSPSMLDSMSGRPAGGRYSVISTGTGMGPENEPQYSGAGHGHHFLSRQEEKLLIPIGATSMATGTYPSSSTVYGGGSRVAGGRKYGSSSGVSPKFDSTIESRHLQMKGGLLSGSSGVGSGGIPSAMKKSSTSSQPMFLRIDDSTLTTTGAHRTSPSPSALSSTSSTGSMGIGERGGLPHSLLPGGSGSTSHYGTSSYPSLAATSPSSPVGTSRHHHYPQQQHHSALGIYSSPSSSALNPSTGGGGGSFLSPNNPALPSSLSSTSLGTDLASSSRRKKHSTLTWAETPTGPPPASISSSMPIVSSSSSLATGRSKGGDVGSSSRGNTSVAGTSPSSYSSLTSSASHFLSSFRSGIRKGSTSAGSSGVNKEKTTMGGSDSMGTTGFGLLGRSSSDKKQKHAPSSASTSGLGYQSQLGVGGGVGSGGLLLLKEGEVYNQFADSPSDYLVMQKSKSSSSVFHHGSGGGGGGSSGGGHHGIMGFGSGSGADKRGSTTSTSSILLPATPTGTSTGRGLMSKSRIFKSRSKSQTRISPSTSGGTCSWTPQGKCKWTNNAGRQVTLQPTTVLHLNETERDTLQKVALAKLQALNLDVEIKIPKEKIGGTLQKPKRRPYLLKKKALSTGFFESGGKDGSKESSGSGLVFGISLSQCVANDIKKQQEQQQSDQSNPVLPRGWESNIPPNASSTSTIKRSQNGCSRNSVSSVFEVPATSGTGKEEKDHPTTSGSNESLFWGRKRGGSNAALDSLSSSSGDLLADQTIPSVDSSPPGSVPSIVTSCIKHLENYGLHTTGIFRVSTSLKRIRQLREEIDSGKVIEFNEEHSPHDIAALLKEFLRDLPEPLLCRDLYQAFLRTQNIRNRKLQLEAVQHLVQLLPVANRDTLVSLLKFFSKVAENASDKRSKTGELLVGNKMEAYSLATLIAPNILPCMPTEGLAGSSLTIDPNSIATKERRESIDVVNYMISNYRELFEVSPELLDEVYVHMMDTHPELVENLFKQRTGQTDDIGDELETTSSVFEGSECGEPADIDETMLIGGGTTTFSSSSKKGLQKREDILHKDGGKGGSGQISSRTEKFHHHHQQKSPSQHASKDSDLDKQQSGGESDSSSTKSASRWFRRAKRGPEHSSSKTRASSDSGSEQTSKGKKGSSDQRRKESLAHEAKRANSLDSVNLSGGSMLPNVITLTEEIFNPHGVVGSGGLAEQNLQVPENINRRQSSPILDSSGIIKASLKIPVPLPVSIDDTDIPYIEDDPSEMIQPRHHQPPPLIHHHHHIIHSHPQPQLMTADRGRSGSTDSAGNIIGRYNTTTMTSRSNTPASSHGGSPLSSPRRQPSSEVSSPLVFSPPMSPSDDHTTFPYEEMTARFCIGVPGGGGGTGGGNSEAATTSSGSGSTSSSIHSGTTIVSKVPNPKRTTSTKTGEMTSTEHGSPAPAITSVVSDSTRITPASISSHLHQLIRPSPSATTLSNPSSSLLTTSPSSSPHGITLSETKVFGRETKGANAGLIKSKTADFEKLSAASAAASASSSPSTSSQSPTKIASSMRLRSQGNIQLKQQFLLRHHEKQTLPPPPSSTMSTNLKSSSSSATVSDVSKSGTQLPTTETGRSLLMQKKKVGSSSSAISTSSGAPSSTSPSLISSQIHKFSSPHHQLDSSSSHAKPGSSSSTSSATPVSTGGGGSSSRWKRSEIIASRQTGSSS